MVVRRVVEEFRWSPRRTNTMILSLICRSAKGSEMLNSTTVRDYMAAYLVTFRVDTPVVEAINTLLQYRISGAPVVDARHRIVGILSEKDCLNAVLVAANREQPQAAVGSLMSNEVKTVDVEMSITAAAQKFLADSVRRYPVLENGELVGQISRRDILRAFARVVEDQSSND